MNPAAIVLVLLAAFSHAGWNLINKRLSGYDSVAYLSLVYPLARGTGPMLSSLAAVALFGERPGAWGIAGSCSPPRPSRPASSPSPSADLGLSISADYGLEAERPRTL